VKALFLPVAVAFGLGIVAQDPFDDAKVVGEPVAGSVHMLTGYGGNIGISAGADGVLMVDDQFAPLEDKIRAAIAEVSEARPSYLVNTHWHGDHVGGNAGFQEDALIVAHGNVRKRMETGNERTAPAAAEALPELTFDNSVMLHFNGERIEVMHLPSGHTDGDSIVIFHDSKVVHMGDLFFHGMFPFIDPASGGSLNGYRANVQTVLDNTPPDWKIIPGHGPLASHKDLQSFAAMLDATTKVVAGRIAEGMDRDAAIAAGLGEQWAGWSWGFIPTDRWIGTLYDELSKSSD
jgi:cyclase